MEEANLKNKIGLVRRIATCMAYMPCKTLIICKLVTSRYLGNEENCSVESSCVIFIYTLTVVLTLSNDTGFAPW